MDGRPNRRNKGAFSSFSGVVRARPKKDSYLNDCILLKITYFAYHAFSFIRVDRELGQRVENGERVRRRKKWRGEVVSGESIPNWNTTEQSKGP